MTKKIMAKRIPMCWECVNGITEPATDEDGTILIHGNKPATKVIGCKKNKDIHSLIDAQTMCPILLEEE